MNGVYQTLVQDEIASRLAGHQAASEASFINMGLQLEEKQYVTVIAFVPLRVTHLHDRANIISKAKAAQPDALLNLRAKLNREVTTW